MTEGASPVKPFSCIPSLFRAILFFYSAFYFPSLDLSFPVISWIIFFTGLFFAFRELSSCGRIALILQKITILKILRTFILFLLIAFHIRGHLIERVRVNGKSMNPTLQSGETVWVEKVTTGILLPEIKFPFRNLLYPKKIPLNGLRNPARFDIVVFSYPGILPEDGRHFIKRVVALPGEEYEFKENKLFIGGMELKESYLSDPQTEGPVHRGRFDLPDDLQFAHPDVLNSAVHGMPAKGRVPEGSVMVLGDNRKYSNDSRSMGFIPLFYIEGRVMYR